MFIDSTRYAFALKQTPFHEITFSNVIVPNR